MCVILYALPNAPFDVDELSDAMEDNPDGNGIIIVNGDSKVIVKRGLSPEETITTLLNAPDSAHRVLHARIATSGGINKAMIHPFSSPSGRYLLAHNGIITSDGLAGDDNESDTAKTARRLDAYASKGRGHLDNLAKRNHSRLLVVDRISKAVELYGSWTLDGGIYRSNKNHLTKWSYAATTVTKSAPTKTVEECAREDMGYHASEWLTMTKEEQNMRMEAWYGAEYWD